MNYRVNITDQLGNNLLFMQVPKRIVSLVPSITHLLYSFGLDETVTGITRFCKFPEHWKKEKTIVGGTKDFKLDKIAALSPDLIIGSKEENVKDKIEELQTMAPVYISDVSDMKSNMKLIRDLGLILQRKTQANALIDKINSEIKEMNFSPLRAAYIIWQKPYMSVGGDTFIHQMMHYAGFDNVFKNLQRYPVFQPEDLIKLNPQVILLASEPYPFKEKHQKEWKYIFKETNILLVKGEPFTWFGAYPVQAFNYFKQLRKQV
jgi:ABC-type Fe3+-hydroxamate transport system substrate-binding protein